MATHHLLSDELDQEIKKTRAALARVPADQASFTPHPKSMPLGKLAAHVAQLGGFAIPMLTQPELDFATAGMKPLQFESPAQLVAAFEQGTAAVKQQLARTPEEAWTQPWKLRASDKVFFSGNRYTAYRAMYLNHLVHHRAQLGVYLRLLNVPVPSTYGPSADEMAPAEA